MLDYIEIEQVSLNNQCIRSMWRSKRAASSACTPANPITLFNLQAAHKPPQPGEPCYALVRQFDRPQRSEYPIVILIPEDKQAWLVSSQPAGAAETIIGEREWIFYEGGPKITESKVQVVGVVVAILTPLPAQAASNSS